MPTDDERLYTIPLRMAHRVPRTKRAERAVQEVRAYVSRHMKAELDKVWLDGPVNEALWARSIQKPPPRIRVKAVKFEDGVIEVSLPETEKAGSRREEMAQEREKAKEEALPKGEPEEAPAKAEEPAEPEKAKDEKPAPPAAQEPEKTKG